MAATALACISWIETTGTAKIAAGEWKQEGVDADSAPIYKQTSDDAIITVAQWLALPGADISRCAEVQAAEEALAALKACAGAANNGASCLAISAVIAAATALAF